MKFIWIVFDKIKQMKLIDGKKIAKQVTAKAVKEMESLEGRHPGLAMILIGEREDSKLYVSLKEKEAKKVGIDTHTYKCGSDISEQEVLEMIEHLNGDEEIDAILVQLPLPEKFDADKIIRALDPKKDVDRFHPENLEVLLKTCDHGHVIPPVFGVILEMLEEIDCDLNSKQICVVANSEIFGKSLAKVLECNQAKVELADPSEKKLEEKTKKADVLVTAVGKPGLIGEGMVKKDAVVIDVGITKEGKKVLGDVNFDDVKDEASFITPVPGGVGPVTVAMLLLNTVRLAKERGKQ